MAETRNRLRPFPVRPKKATVSPRGSKASERPPTNSLLMEKLSHARSKPPVRFWITAPSLVETSTTSASPSERFAVMTAAISPEGLGAKPKAWVKLVFSGFGERSRPKSSGRCLSRNGLKRSFSHLSKAASNSSGVVRKACLNSSSVEPPRIPLRRV